MWTLRRLTSSGVSARNCIRANLNWKTPTKTFIVVFGQCRFVKREQLSGGSFAAEAATAKALPESELFFLLLLTLMLSLVAVFVCVLPVCRRTMTWSQPASQLTQHGELISVNWKTKGK